MDKPEVAAALQEYEDAMAEFLTSVRARDTRSDFPLRQRLYAAGVEIERLRLRGTPAYNDAVLRADRNSWPVECAKSRASLRARRMMAEGV
jgi:hypothetical protein